jgi:predicted PurR-regulated permease PerM
MHTMLARHAACALLVYASSVAEDKNADRFYTALVVIALVLFGLVVRPFIEGLFLATVLAGALYPIQRRLVERLRGRRNLSAALLSSAVVLILLGPIVGIGTVLVQEVLDGTRFVMQTVQSDGVVGLIDELPAPMRDYAHQAIERAPMEPEKLDQFVREKVSAQQGSAAQTARRVVGTTGSFLLQSAMMIVALFFMLVDGPRLVAWCEDASPLPTGQTTELLKEFREVSVSVMVANVATGAVQTAAALIGYLIAGVPNAWFFAVLTFFMSFIPTVGAGGTSLLAALLLLATGKVGMAIFLAVWGTLAVGVSDNLIKPLIARRGMHMHGAIVFFALVGGLGAFGTIGLILGPLIVSFMLALVRLRKRSAQPQLVLASDVDGSFRS